MKIIIQDASVLIDLADSDLLEAWFNLGFDQRATRLILREVSRKNQWIKLQKYVDDGRLGIEFSSGEILTEIARLQATMSTRLTIEGVSALFFADRLGCILLTGDRRLR